MSQIIDLLKSVNAIITDSHLVYTSGKHGNVYINKDGLYPHTEQTSQVGKMFAEAAKDIDVDVVVGPMLGGIILSTWTAYHLSKLKGKEVFSVYTEKGPDKSMIFTRGYDKFITGKNVYVVEDITNTGGSAKKVVEAVKAIGGNVVQVGVMVNRDPVNVTSEYMGVPFVALGVLNADAFDAADCPMCKNNEPINTSVGHGKKYLEAKGLL